MIMGNDRTDRRITDQSVREQYNRETGQIHAPESLIRRTKETVREKERRIAQEGSERQENDCSARQRRAFGRLYRWALPVTAAGLAILVGVSGIFFGRGRDKAWEESVPEEDYYPGDTDQASTDEEKQAQFERHLQKQEEAFGEDTAAKEPEAADPAETTESAADSGATQETMQDALPDTENEVKETAGAKLQAQEQGSAQAEDSDAGIAPALKSVQFYDKDQNIVEAEALWYNAARIESILLRWEGGTPSNIKVFRTPAGSETMEQTELLLTKSIADGEESVLLDADILRDSGMGSHLFFELDFGTQIVTSEEYNILYDEDMLPDAGGTPSQR